MQTTIGKELKTQFLLLSLRNKNFEPYIGLPYFKDLYLRVKVRDKVAPTPHKHLVLKTNEGCIYKT